MTLHVGISTDHSGSMSSRRAPAYKDYIAFVEALKESSKETGQEIRITHSMCSVDYGDNRFSVINAPVTQYVPFLVYDTPGPCTRLYDSVLSLIGEMRLAAANDKNAVFLVQVVTDGADNASNYSSQTKLIRLISELQATDRWTIVFRVPKGMKNSMVGMGIPADNIQEWELSSAGLEQSTFQTQSALRSFTSSVASGAVTFTQKFYANMDNVTSSQVKAALRDISQEVVILPVSGAEGQQIRSFIETRLGIKYKKGAGFYQLTKTESAVQDYKKILIRDKTTNAIYEGSAARDLIGVPHTGNIKLVPGKHGNYDIFIQSTSVNRSLDKNTQLIYWAGFDQPYVAQVPVKVDVKSTAPGPITTTWPFTNSPNIPEPKPVIKGGSKFAPAAKKIAAKTAPKKRIRDRNTIQQKVRDWLRENAKVFVPAKKVINTLPLSELGIDDVLILLNLQEPFHKKFGIETPRSQWLKSKTVGDIVKFVE